MNRWKSDVRAVFDGVRASDALKARTAQAIGERARARAAARRGRMRGIAACAACAALLLAGGLTYDVCFAASAYIDIDVNPSLELTLNRLGRVVASNAYNAEGADVLRAANVRNAPLPTALSELMGVMQRQGYLENAALVSVTVQSRGTAQALIAGIESALTDARAALQYGADDEVYAVSEDVKSSAHAHHMSPAMYEAISGLQAVDPDASFDECRDHSLLELRHYAQDDGVQHDHDDECESDDEDGQCVHEDGTSHGHDAEHSTEHQETHER